LLKYAIEYITKTYIDTRDPKLVMLRVDILLSFPHDVECSTLFKFASVMDLCFVKPEGLDVSAVESLTSSLAALGDAFGDWLGLYPVSTSASTTTLTATGTGAPSRVNPAKVAPNVHIKNAHREIMEADVNRTFRVPVIEAVPALKTKYLSVISRPMDLRTMYRKVESYLSFDMYLSDLHLMLDNCDRFNPEGDPTREYCKKFRGRVDAIVRKHKEKLSREMSTFNVSAPPPPAARPQASAPIRRQVSNVDVSKMKDYIIILSDPRFSNMFITAIYRDLLENMSQIFSSESAAAFNAFLKEDKGKFLSSLFKLAHLSFNAGTLVQGRDLVSQLPANDDKTYSFVILFLQFCVIPSSFFDDDDAAAASAEATPDELKPFMADPFFRSLFLYYAFCRIDKFDFERAEHALDFVTSKEVATYIHADSAFLGSLLNRLHGKYKDRYNRDRSQIKNLDRMRDIVFNRLFLPMLDSPVAFVAHTAHSLLCKHVKQVMTFWDPEYVVKVVGLIVSSLTQNGAIDIQSVLREVNNKSIQADLAGICTARPEFRSRFGIPGPSSSSSNMPSSVTGSFSSYTGTPGGQSSLSPASGGTPVDMSLSPSTSTSPSAKRPRLH
jgi:hypothetical protein